MTMNAHDTAWHTRYENLDEKTKDAVNDAWRAARDELRHHNIVVANDDRAEQFVAAITRYVIESKE